MWGLDIRNGSAEGLSVEDVLINDTYYGLDIKSMKVKFWVDPFCDFFAEKNMTLFDFISEEIEGYTCGEDGMIDEEDAPDFRLLVSELDRIKKEIERHLP